MATDTVTLSAAEATAVAAGGLCRIGFDADEVDSIAAHLVESELAGYPALGLCRVLTIAEHPLTRKPRTPITVTYQTPSSARIDGGNHVGMHVIRRAAEVAIQKASTVGLALVGVHNTFLSGRNAYYLDIIAGAGLAGIHLASSPPIVAPLGGRAPAFGTNPIALGLPHRPHPLVFDIATSAVNVGDLRLAAHLGQQLPADAAIDAGGRPTVDATAALAGAILPFGGHKGYELSFAIQAFCLLGGAAITRGQSQDFGFLFLVFDPHLLMPPGELQGQVDDLIAHVRATPREPGAAEIRIPSERAYAERARRLVDGIEVPRKIVERIEGL